MTRKVKSHNVNWSKIKPGKLKVDCKSQWSSTDFTKKVITQRERCISILALNFLRIHWLLFRNESFTMNIINIHLNATSRILHGQLHYSEMFWWLRPKSMIIIICLPQRTNAMWNPEYLRLDTYSRYRMERKTIKIACNFFCL